jgi:hypothetical protein
VVAALVGQLAALAHAVLVEHVTCGADGELIHVRAGAAPAAPERDAARAALDGEDDAHDHCLLDEDGEAVCPTSPFASGSAVQPGPADHSIRRCARVDRAPAPLYRLAPKNSPPA